MICFTEPAKIFVGLQRRIQGLQIVHHDDGFVMGDVGRAGTRRSWSPVSRGKVFQELDPNS